LICTFKDEDRGPGRNSSVTPSIFGEMQETGQWIAKSRSKSPYESRVLGDYSHLLQSYISSMTRRMSEQTQDAQKRNLVVHRGRLLDVTRFAFIKG